MWTEGSLNQTLISLLNYFDMRGSLYKVFLYKNIPISHVRLHKPYYQDSYSYLINPKVAGSERILPILDKLTEVINTHDIIVEQSELAKLLKNIDVGEENSFIKDIIINMSLLQVFAEEISEGKKFNDPITVSNSDGFMLDVHPGRTRISALEYLFLKNKKEYYVDAIFYSNINKPKGFLIDKECTEITSAVQFINAYGYKNLIEFKAALKNMKMDLVLDDNKKYYISKDFNIDKYSLLSKFNEFRNSLVKI